MAEEKAMKMLIKFLSDEPILNVLSPIYLKPEETVFIGKQGECYEREGRRLSVLLRALGASLGSVRYIPVDVYDTERIIRELETLHVACHDCARGREREQQRRDFRCGRVLPRDGRADDDVRPGRSVLPETSAARRTSKPCGRKNVSRWTRCCALRAVQ